MEKKLPKKDPLAGVAPAETEGKNTFELLACTNTAVRRASRRLGNLYDDVLEPLGLKATQLALLNELEQETSRNKGLAPTLQDLAAKASLQISALTHALRPLIRDGLVQLEPDEEDRRTKRAVLTDLGATNLSEALKIWEKANQRVEEVLGADATHQLKTVTEYIISDRFLQDYNKLLKEDKARPSVSAKAKS